MPGRSRGGGVVRDGLGEGESHASHHVGRILGVRTTANRHAPSPAAMIAGRFWIDAPDDQVGRADALDERPDVAGPPIAAHPSSGSRRSDRCA